MEVRLSARWRLSCQPLLYFKEEEEKDMADIKRRGSLPGVFV
jgi:hypothetical protein